jgi:hypothetical protein
MTLAEKIQTELIGSHYGSTTEMEEILTQIVGENVSWYDSNIDDGVDDDETEDMYVMRDAFSTDDDKINIRIYYGDMTGEITYVSVN